MLYLIPKMLIKWVKSKDEIIKPIANKLHVDSPKNSFLGGLVSIIIEWYLIYCIISRTYDMVTYHEPQTITKFQNLKDDMS